MAYVEGQSAFAYARIVKSDDGLFPDLGAGWVDVDGYNEMGPMQDVTADLASGVITFNKTGVYQLVIGCAIVHDSINNGRTFYFRLRNTSDGGTVSNPVPVGVGRNQTDTLFEATTLFRVTETALGDSVILQLGGGDVIQVDSLGASLFTNRIAN